MEVPFLQKLPAVQVVGAADRALQNEPSGQAAGDDAPGAQKKRAGQGLDTPLTQKLPPVQVVGADEDAKQNEPGGQATGFGADAGQ